ncbi:MAG: NAD/NADP octopine/nopaline dehydrogenase family protein [Actinomycetota bacterium]|nr:NAD/NADP octopine/nopaline dehydrogenase family protein [Actinomycetota bacterium]
MSRVAVLGAGAGGLSAAVDLTRRGHDIRLWNRSQETLEPLKAAKGIKYEGVLGDGDAEIACIDNDLAHVLAGAEVVVVTLPALAHEHVARALAMLGCTLPVILNPGHTGGALHWRKVFARSGSAPPPIAELSTLTYVARKQTLGSITISGVAGRVHAACLPGHEQALSFASALWASATPAPDVLATGLANVNMVLHPPGAVLAAAWVEATKGDFLFYVDAMTPGVARVIELLDAERLAVARSFGHALPALIEEMAAVGTVGSSDAHAGDVGSAIARGEANARIRAPASLSHRYYREDFGYGLVPLIALAGMGDVDVTLAPALLRVAEAVTGEELAANGLTADRMGIEDLDVDGLLAVVREHG